MSRRSTRGAGRAARTATPGRSASAGERSSVLGLVDRAERRRRSRAERRQAPSGTRSCPWPSRPARPISSPGWISTSIGARSLCRQHAPARAGRPSSGRACQRHRLGAAPRRRARHRSSARPARAGCASPRSRVATVSPDAQHGDTVGELLDLVHAMGDEEDPTPSAQRSAQNTEQVVARRDIERRRRLVEDQDSRRPHQHARDTDRLAIAQCRDAPPAASRSRTVDQPARALSSPRLDAPRRRRWRKHPVATEPDVRQHRLLPYYQDLLEDRGDHRAPRESRGEPKACSSCGPRSNVDGCRSRADARRRGS